VTERLEPGYPVEVYNTFTRAWTGGFIVVATDDAGYRLRRTDGTVLPAVFDDDDVRPAPGGDRSNSHTSGRPAACHASIPPSR